MGTGSFLNLWAVQMRWEFKQEREKVTYSLIRMISCNVCRCCPYRDFSLKESQTDDQHCLGMSFPWDLKSHTSPILYPPLGIVPNRFYLSQKQKYAKLPHLGRCGWIGIKGLGPLTYSWCRQCLCDAWTIRRQDPDLTLETCPNFTSYN